MKNLINAGYLPDRGLYGLWVYAKSEGMKARPLLTNVGPVVHEPGTCAAPSIEIDKIQAERLMTQLWAEGIRPQDWGTEGQVAALTNHLEDMRKIAFSRLEVKA